MSDIIAFTEYMFRKNTNNRPIHLNLEGIESNKDLFLFFIDLFCKGLVVCYGVNNKVNFDDLNMDKFAYIKQKMANAGIQIDLNVKQHPTELQTFINSDEIDAEPEDKELKDYVFKLYNHKTIYEIKFKLGRPPGF